MKKCISVLALCLVPSLSWAAKEKYDPAPLYTCHSDQESHPVNVSLHRRLSGVGPQKFVGVVSYSIPEGDYFREHRLNLTPILEGRIVSFTSADLRVRFDRVKHSEGRMKAFMQIPKLQIYTDKWTCVGPTYAELPTL